MSSDWRGVRRVLAVRLDSMGDVLMTTPALRAIRENVEHVTLLTSPAGAAVARLIPEIDEVIVYAAPWMKASANAPVADDRAMIERLAGKRFDAAIVFTVFSQTPFPAAMLARLADIPRVLLHARERAYGLASNEVRETEPESGIRHEVQRHLDLVATLGWTPSDNRLSMVPPVEAQEHVAALNLPRGRWCVVHPGASAPSRRWPAEYFAETVRLLGARGWQCVLTGDAHETELCASIAADASARNLAGQLDLGELAALIGQAPLIMTNNSGPAHIAAAMGTPVVDLYALTNPQHTPWQVPSRVLSHDVECRWCFSSVCRTGHHLCLRGVMPERVVAAALELTGAAAAEAA